MRFDANCIGCLIKKQTELALRLGDRETARSYMEDVLREILNAPEDAAAPYLNARMTDVYAGYTGVADMYADVKRESNAYMLKKLPAMRAAAAASPDPLLAALKFAAVGNYIDFGALAGRVSMEELDSLLAAAGGTPIDGAEYKSFVSDAGKAGRLLYIADNSGELVADLVLAEQLAAAFPKLDICFAVRGRPVQNDALRSDADDVGISAAFRVVDSGTNIGGTQIRLLGEEMRRELTAADMTIAKGQGNFESMNGCGLNVYYLFMCKCVRFTELFGVPLLTGLFVNERRVPRDTVSPR